MQHSTRLTSRGLGLLAGLMLLLLHPGVAQQFAPSSSASIRQNTWLMFLSDARLSKRWGLHTEVQVLRTRTSELGYQNVFRGGANYYFSDNLLLTGGYAYSQDVAEDHYPGASGPEHRLYQQLQLRDAKNRVQLQQRYRLEQRWVRLQPDQDFTYLNRLRYQLRLAIPLLGRELTSGVPFAVVADEIFLGFGQQAKGRLFQQNRAYVGIGYQISTASSVEIGYLNQFVQLPQDSRPELNENMQISLCFHPDWRRTQPSIRP
ncbi:DUF2490 domain-containing protein [Hymenobacter metallilatus]|uniref:DUF2490 domain-containing protein n=1 Tax=Hymenobacter metallilatus TaxID=2493666 RepID=A0A428JPC7_9BACT|nr:DUF2490 domain-containing protein [Hymenobacter metallilatus]RSK35305.1 DUF2490 domain-containing protein [Hymenobacter metallilatus]